MLILIALPGVVAAQDGDDPEVEAKLRIELAQAYEDAGLWEEAEIEYRAVLALPDNTYTVAARAGLDRVLQARRSFWNSLLADLRQFSLWLVSGVLKVLVIGGLGYLALRIVVLRFAMAADWVMLPFSDHSGKDLGGAVVELIADSLHKARLTHMRANGAMLVMSEQADISALFTQRYEKRLLTSLASLNSLAVGGIDLPIGTILESLMQWLGAGRKEIVGSIWWSREDVRLSARLEEGRRQQCTHTWEVRGLLGQEKTESDILFDLSEQLAFRILFDSQQGWNTKSSEALRFFTRGLAAVQKYDAGIRDELLLEQAETCFSQALALDPLYQPAQCNLAFIRIHLGRYHKAVELLRPLRNRVPKTLVPSVTYNLGVAYYHMAHDWAYDYAEEAFHVVVGMLRRARSSEKKELLALAYCGLVGVAAQRVHQDAATAEQHCAEAASYFEAATAKAGNKRNVQAIAKTALGLAYLHCREYAEAVRLFQAATGDQSDHWRAYVHWGRAEMAQENLEEALVHLKQATALNSHSQFAQFNLGLTYKRLGQLDEAIQAFEKAPTIARSHNELGEILAGREEFEVALGEFESAVAINSRLAEAWANLAWYTLEAGCTDEESLREATRWAKRAVACDKGTDREWHKRAVLGRVYLGRGMLDDAEQEFTLALEQKPSNAQSHYYRAEIAWRRGEPERAKSLLIDFFKLEHKGVWHGKAVSLMRQVQEDLQQSRT